MLHARWILAAALIAAPLFAQDAPEKTEKKEAVPAAPIIPPKAEAPADASAEVKQLTDDFNKAQQEFFKPYREAAKRGEKIQLDWTKHPRKTFSPKFKALAEKHAGTDAALDAWLMVARTGGNREEICAVILKDHIKSEGMVNAVSLFAYLPNGDAMLEKIVTENPHRNVKGYALLTRGEALLRKGDERAEAMLVDVKENYGDVPIYGGRMTAGKKAEGDLFEARNLTVGKEAPEIEGEDIDGVVFKLSDYRGKVILLDFWGDW
ncbi:MAG: peroxiredoxin family protein [Planctomycetota bacterium]|jgi:hypothetical protein